MSAATIYPQGKPYTEQSCPQHQGYGKSRRGWRMDFGTTLAPNRSALQGSWTVKAKESLEAIGPVATKDELTKDNPHSLSYIEHSKKEKRQRRTTLVARKTKLRTGWYSQFSTNRVRTVRAVIWNIFKLYSAKQTSQMHFGFCLWIRITDHASCTVLKNLSELRVERRRSKGECRTRRAYFSISTWVSLLKGVSFWFLLRGVFSDLSPVEQTTNQIGNRILYWVYMVGNKFTNIW